MPQTLNNRLGLMSAFMKREKIQLQTEDGWGCVGLIQSLTHEDGSACKYIAHVYACDALYPCTVHFFIKFNPETYKLEQCKVI